ncbi:NepR family anti-sigma factor [Methylocystis parvus]|uniref:Anti-sigma factor NepR domain-containing protein n=1 Tax=Methylocystis parvus TaxID=134 RepID=A0A6B8M4G4_9HYPH|nr:NepR family anti-sigma factor [Methylocystis parvus]QGM96273.1 hypothetical protein F7D14_01420 [Methylocystis parvus]WBJ99891.1 hypothetical protein MMG94_18205 [Methylocystis parvus OBBP]
MNLLEFGSTLSPSDSSGARSPATGGRRGYDELSGAALLRRSGKSAAISAPLRGDKAATLLSARNKVEAQDRIGRELSNFYQSMLREPVPERFVALIDALEAQGR